MGLLGLVLCMSAAPAAQQSEFVIKPPYAPAPELTGKDGVPKGTVHRLIMKSEDSKIYPGISRDKPGVVVPYERVVNVYVPAQYKPGTPAPFIVVQDGDSPRYRDPLPVILDNLISQKRVPAMIAVMVHNGGSDGFGSQRGLEYDTVSDKYTTFIDTEVLRRVAKEYNLTFTTDPEGRATMGGSSGAACAFTMASQFTRQANPHLDARERERPRRQQRRGVAAQLRAGQPAHGGRAENERLQVPLYLRRRRWARGSRGGQPDVARRPRVALAGICE
jgi:hypothetical protein